MYTQASLFNPNLTINLSTHRGKKVYTVHIHSYEYTNGRFAKAVAFAYLIPRELMYSFENGGHQDKK
jgi:hypothetical protein